MYIYKRYVNGIEITNTNALNLEEISTKKSEELRKLLNNYYSRPPTSAAPQKTS